MISLNEYVPEDHRLTAVKRYLDLSEFLENLAQSYSHPGRPSVDPELMAHFAMSVQPNPSDRHASFVVELGLH